MYIHTGGKVSLQEIHTYCIPIFSYIVLLTEPVPSGVREDETLFS